VIRDATETDASELTRIAFDAKRHWGYPEQYLSIWKSELTITIEYIATNFVRVKEVNQKIAGFYSLVWIQQSESFGGSDVTKCFWLDHMFILPVFHKQGIGIELFQDLCHVLKEREITEIKIFVDPNAEGFYRKMGAAKLKMSDSSIPGRQIPIYEFKLKT
jgi:GNAT superfamily N-acetyltransferase